MFLKNKSIYIYILFCITSFDHHHHHHYLDVGEHLLPYLPQSLVIRDRYYKKTNPTDISKSVIAFGFSYY